MKMPPCGTIVPHGGAEFPEYFCFSLLFVDFSLWPTPRERSFGRGKVSFFREEKQGWIRSTISFEKIPKVHHGIDEQDHDDKAGGIRGPGENFPPGVPRSGHIRSRRHPSRPAASGALFFSCKQGFYATKVRKKIVSCEAFSRKASRTFPFCRAGKKPELAPFQAQAPGRMRKRSFRRFIPGCFHFFLAQGFGAEEPVVALHLPFFAVHAGMATPHDPAVGTMTSSPGRQSAGRATPKWSEVCRPMSTRLISSKLRPKERG